MTDHDSVLGSLTHGLQKIWPMVTRYAQFSGFVLVVRIISVGANLMSFLICRCLELCHLLAKKSKMHL